MCGSSSLRVVVCYIFVFKQKTAYEMRISDWSSDVCSSDLSVLAKTASRRCSFLIGVRRLQSLHLRGRKRVQPEWGRRGAGFAGPPASPPLKGGSAQRFGGRSDERR